MIVCVTCENGIRGQRRLAVAEDGDDDGFLDDAPEPALDGQHPGQEMLSTQSRKFNHLGSLLDRPVHNRRALDYRGPQLQPQAASLRPFDPTG